jgi:ribosomal protein S18 acetylase RimI-like enzyme
VNKSKLNAPSFRQANPNDRDALEQMILAYYLFDNQTVEISKIHSSLDIALTENPHVMIWIIEVDKELVGYFALAIGFTIEAGGKDGFLDELFVKEKYRDRGIGRAAVKFALDICPSMEIRRLSLEVETHNLRAKRLYRDIGFFTHDRILMSHWVD